ncbi:cold shock domain-containing protein [Bacteroides sp. OttesenSCG-928-D19]|nr:cold shock domain-containing protein [Bacteroides sp. OttesenSCG-928-D19]
MAKPPSSNKRENEKKKLSKRKEKQERKEERKNNNSGNSFEIAYVDEFGMITSTPPEIQKKEEIDMDSIIISTPKKEEEEVPAELRGRVEFFNQSKGFGFIKDLASANKYFFHISQAPQGLLENNIVFFELERGNKGMNAVRIRIDK